MLALLILINQLINQSINQLINIQPGGEGGGGRSIMVLYSIPLGEVILLVVSW